MPGNGLIIFTFFEYFITTFYRNNSRNKDPNFKRLAENKNMIA